MKVLIVGAGGQGGPCAAILARDKNVREIGLVDLDGGMAEKVAAKIGCDKIKPGKVDATVVEQVAKAAEGADVIMDFVIPWMANHVMKAALAVGANYVNSAFDIPFWDELIQGRPLSLHQEFSESGLTALLGCGMAPGFVNVIARIYCDKLDEVESIKIRLGKKKTGGGEYDDYVKPWNPGWAPVQALKDCGDNAACFKDGKYQLVPPYAGIEEWQFPEPVGKMLVSHHSHEEPYSLPLTIGKGLKYCDFKYYLHPQPAALVALGLVSDREVEVGDVKVKPIDLIASILPKPGNAFLDEDPLVFKYNDAHNYVQIDVEVKGKKEREERTYVAHLPNMNVPGQVIYDLFGTSMVSVALPAVIGARQILEGGYKGVIFAEQLDPDKYLELLRRTGYPYDWDWESR